jgi:hypothetical protein
MLAATGVAVFLIPVTFFVVETLAERRRLKKRAEPQAGPSGASPAESPV